MFMMNLMFGIGLTEVIVIIIVFLVMVDPKNAPSFIESIKEGYRKFIYFRKEMLDYINNEDSKTNFKQKGIDGNYYDSYCDKTIEIYDVKSKNVCYKNSDEENEKRD